LANNPSLYAENIGSGDKYYRLSKMNYKNDKTCLCKGYRASSIEHRASSKALTLLEMVIALAIMAIVFAAILPQFRAILNSWDSKQASAEVLQNGRVLIDHLNRNLSKAVRITAVSTPTETAGYIEFEDNDGDTLRYDIADNNYVQFGSVGDLSDMAGPVSQLQFTCYDAFDFDTPITDVNDIRSVKVETTLTNPAAMGQDKTFIAQAYLRTNANHETGLVGWWKLDESSGLTAADSSGNGNDGTLTNMSGDEWTTGQIDGALELDGSNDYVNVGDAASLDITDAITVTAWIKPSNPGGNWQSIIANSPTGSQYNYWFYLESNALKLSVYSSTYPNLTVSNAIGTADIWYHVAFTAIDGSTMKIFVNGKEVGSGTAGTGHWSGGYTTIGDLRPGRKIHFNGSIDDVRIYDRALSAEEIAGLAGVLEAHYKFDDDTSSSILWLKLDETSGLTAADSSGNGNDGTLTNMSGNEWTAGQIDGALDFDGSNDCVSCGDLRPITEYTAEAWIKADNLTGSGDQNTYGFTIMASAHSGQGYPLWLTVGKGSATEVTLRAFESSTTGHTTTNANLNTVDWFHIAATAIKGSTAKVYVNGVEKLSFTAGNTNWTDIFTIGDLRPHRRICFDGTIDNIRIYNRALSAEDVAIIFAGGTPTHTPYQTATDSSGNGNDATLGITDEPDDRDPSWVTGVVGTAALSFDGEDDFAHTADSDTGLLLSGNYSTSVWIKADASQKQWAGIYTKTNSSGTKNHWTLQFNDHSSRKIVVRHDGNNSWDTKIKLSDIAGDWHKVQITRRDTTMSAYLDDVLVKSGTFKHNPTTEPGHLNIGAGRTASDSSVFKGEIDDLYIYDLPDDDVGDTILP